MIGRTRLAVGIGVVLVAACGSQGGDDDGFPGAASSGGPNNGPGSSSGASGASSGTTPPPSDTTLEGVWQVKGSDARGTYAGHVEIAPPKGGAGAPLRFTRVVRYDTVKVEGGRELWWVWEGTAKGTRVKLDVDLDLRRADFVKRRGTLERTASDGPVHVKGSFAGTANDMIGTFDGGSNAVAEKETWSARTDSKATPLFAGIDRTVLPGHDPPSATEKSTMFSSFSSYQSLPPVTPYNGRPEFQAAIHGFVVDRTDADFYRANPNAIRVVDKVIDDISLGETLLRANAYRLTLVDKATRFQQDIDDKFMDPTVGMIVDGGAPTGPFNPSGDSALWTGTYVAAQAYQYEVTGDVKTLGRLKISLNALLELQEITNGDWSTFARTLRKASGSGTPPMEPWRAGTGSLSAYEWLAGGNNDMIKGLLYGYFMGWRTLCKGTTPLDAGLCDRIKTNAKHLADDVKIERPNELETHWLTAVVRNDFAYELKAMQYWVPHKIELQNNPLLYTQGISDWSGNHLTFVGRTIQSLYASEKNLNGEAVQVVKESIDASHAKVEKARMTVWNLIHAAYGSGAKSGPFVDDMKWRLREIPYPKLGFEIDHRIAPEFCMSPYPNVPWKNDWTSYPQPDRTQSLVHYPTFEMPVDVVYFKQHAAYSGGGDYETPGVEFLHVYWYARKHGLITASE